MVEYFLWRLCTKKIPQYLYLNIKRYLNKLPRLVIWFTKTRTMEQAKTKMEHCRGADIAFVFLFRQYAGEQPPRSNRSSESTISWLPTYGNRDPPIRWGLLGATFQVYDHTEWTLLNAGSAMVHAAAIRPERGTYSSSPTTLPPSMSELLELQLSSSNTLVLQSTDDLLSDNSSLSSVRGLPCLRATARIY